MEEKVLKFDNGADRLLALAQKNLDEQKYEKALRFLFSALKNDKSAEVYEGLATTFAEMEVYELSNKYWIKFLDVSPESDWGNAYEELGVNYFYMDNYYLSSYFFNKKIKKDGYLKRDDLSDEIVEYFSKDISKKALYRVVYPFQFADFSEELKFARSMLAEGKFKRVEEIADGVPKGAKEYYDALDIKSLSLFLRGEVDKAIEVNKTIITEKGENVSSLCNLSSFYNYKGDSDKSRFYYDKAMKIEGSEEENYKKATCSLEQGEHKVAVSYLQNIIQDRPYELNLKYLLALALLNAKEYEKSKKEFFELLTLCPDNSVYRFYHKTAIDLIENKKGLEKKLPFSYDNDLPKFEKDRIKKNIDAYFLLDLKKMKKEFSKDEFNYVLRWAFTRGDDESVKKLSLILVTSNDSVAKEHIFNLLNDSEIADNNKASLLFSFIVNGYVGKVGISCGEFYNRIKLRKLGFETDEKYNYLHIAYAVLMTKLAFLEIENFDKIAFATNKVYKKVKDKKDFENFEKNELAGLILYVAQDKRFHNKNDICKLLRIKKDNFEKILKEYNGEEDDKNN